MQDYLNVIKKYAVFDGRARRQEYWMFYLINAIIGGILGTIDIFTSGYSFISGAYGLFVLLPSLGVSIRRLHDTGRSGWWIFISLVPIIGGIWYLILMILDSQQGTNEYGPSVKYPAASEAD